MSEVVKCLRALAPHRTPLVEFVINLTMIRNGPNAFGLYVFWGRRSGPFSFLFKICDSCEIFCTIYSCLIKYTVSRFSRYLYRNNPFYNILSSPIPVISPAPSPFPKSPRTLTQLLVTVIPYKWTLLEVFFVMRGLSYCYSRLASTALPDFLAGDMSTSLST